MELEKVLLEAQNTITKLDKTPKEKRNPKLKLEFYKLKLKIINLNYKILEAKVEASQAVLLADVAQYGLDLKEVGASKKRMDLQNQFEQDKTNFNEAMLDYDSQRDSVNQDVKKAEKIYNTALEKIRAKREAAQNEQPLAVLGEAQQKAPQVV